MLREAPNFASLISDPQPLSEVTKSATEEASTAANRSLVELVGALFALPLCTIAGVFLYARQNARRIFIQTASGQPLWMLVPMLLLIDVITVSSVAWYLRPKTADLADLHSFGGLALMASKIQFLLALAVLGLALALQYGILKKFQWKIVRNHASEE